MSFRFANAVCFAFSLLAFSPDLCTAEPPEVPGRGIWNPLRLARDNQPNIIKVLVLNYDPVVPAEKNRHLWEIFGWANPAVLAQGYKEAMERASGGYLRFEIVEWRNINDIYAQRDGYRYTPNEYAANRRAGKGWHDGGGQDYPRLLAEQRVAPLITLGRIDEVWVFSDHFFGLWEASMAGPGAFFINGGVYPEVPSERPFAFYGFSYERAVAEMMHNTSHRAEATLNRSYGSWNLADPTSNWDKFSANDKQSNGKAGVGTCHWPPNANGDYDYGNERTVQSWADTFLHYPDVDWATKPVTRSTWSDGRDYHEDYMRWYFSHLPRAAGVNADGRQNNWWKYLYDFQNYDEKGRPLPPRARLLPGDEYGFGRKEHSLWVAYSSPAFIDPSSIDNLDLVVTGPNGFRQPATLVAVSDIRPGPYRVAKYRVAAPRGRWQAEDEGAYIASLQADQVRDGLGESLPPAEIGGFAVRSARAAELPADDGSAMAFDKLELDVTQTRLLPQERRPVTAFATAGMDRKVEATFLAQWQSSDPQVVSVDYLGVLRGGKAGTAQATARLGDLTATIEVEVTDPGLPIARMTPLPEIVIGQEQPLLIDVAYSDLDGVDASRLGQGDIRVSGPDGIHFFPQLVTSPPPEPGPKCRAKYQWTPPGGKWTASFAGTYSVDLLGFRVADQQSHFAAEQRLGKFKVSGH